MALFQDGDQENSLFKEIVSYFSLCSALSYWESEMLSML